MDQFRLSAIGQIAVNVGDLERATAFYQKTLGMRHLFSVPGAAFFDCASVRLMLVVPTSDEFDHKSSIIYYRVDDVDAAYRHLRSLAVTFVKQPHLIAKLSDHELWMAFFRDPDDNVLALMEERRPADRSQEETA